MKKINESKRGNEKIRKGEIKWKRRINESKRGNEKIRNE